MLTNELFYKYLNPDLALIKPSVSYDSRLDDYSKIKKYYDFINLDKTHLQSNDDICTPMDCVELMIDYLPNELWQRENLKVLDPCCGNGNFIAYAKFKTKLENIYCNEISTQRYLNCLEIFKPINITNKDYFDMKNFNFYDMIMANPPYSGGGNKNRSLSNQFIEHSIDLLKDGGYLCFVTPNNWMTYNNNNTTLKKLLSQGSFLVIDNDIKKFFKGVGSSFVVFVWQKAKFDNKTYVKNNYLIKDEQSVRIPNNLNFIPLYLSNETISIIQKTIMKENNNFTYRCDLHNFTQKDKLSDVKNEVFKYETIHTPRKTRYANIKQDIYDKWIIVIPLSTYFVPYIKHNVNTTQSVGYIEFDSENEAKEFMVFLKQDYIKLIVHLTRYGNFNNIMALKHLNFTKEIRFSNKELETIKSLCKFIKY
nr:methyltransferase [uncultured Campylobacter sp.]